MAENIVAGLFGLNPNEIGQQNYQNDREQAFQYAKLDPFEKANASIYQGAAGLARVGAGMMGMADPREVEAKQNQALQSQIDHSTHEGLLQGAAIFNQAGNPKMAFMYTQAAQARKAQESAIAKEAAQTQLAEVQATELPQMRHQEKLMGLENQKIQIENQRIAAEQRAQDQNLDRASREEAAARANELKEMQINMQDQWNIRDNETRAAIAGMKQDKPLTAAQKLKAKDKYSKDKVGVQVVGQTVDEIVSEIDKLIGDDAGKVKEHGGLKGSVGYLDSKLPPRTTEQSDAQALIAGLMSKLSVEGLAKIRESGSAPGSITEKEWPIFQNYIKTVNPQQSYEQFVQQLKELRMQLKERKSSVKTNFDDRYSDYSDGGDGDALNTGTDTKPTILKEKKIGNDTFINDGKGWKKK